MKTRSKPPHQKALSFFEYINSRILYLNNSKFFAGIVMIMLNIGSKFITIHFSKSTEEYLKMSVSKQIMIFAMAWMGTRDIYTSLILTGIFVILSDHLFNEESNQCIIPYKHRVLHKLAAESPTKVSDAEIQNAKAVLEKAEKDSQLEQHKLTLLKFNSPIMSSAPPSS
jgi:hypothetical protein